MAHRQSRSLGFEMTISVLDFVTICLGATLLLVVMVPARDGAYANVASKKHALELVRKHFARQSRESGIRLAGDLSAGHPALPPPSSVSPEQLEGMSLSTLTEGQRIRRSELLVQRTTDEGRLERLLSEVAPVLERRGVNYLVAYPFDASGGDAEGFGYALGKPGRVRGLAGRVAGATPAAPEAALAAVLEAAGETPTPGEPVVVIVVEPKALDDLAVAITALGCPTAGLFVVGPPLDQPTADTLRTLMDRCERADYFGIRP